MKNPWRRQPTPSPVSVGVWTDEQKIYKNGAYYSQPDSILGPTPGAPSLSLDFGFGQSLNLDFGGFHAVAPPGEEP